MFIEALTVAGAARALDAEVEVVALAARDTDAAVVHFASGENATPEAIALAEALPRRHTDRGLYFQDPAPPWLGETGILAGLDEVELTTITDGAGKAAVADLVAQGTRLALALPKMRRELARLTYWDAEACEVGMPVQAMVPDVHPDGAAPEWTLRHLSPEDDAAGAYERYSTTPVICVLSTRCDDPAAWVSAGRAGMRFLLRAAVDGLTHCIAAAPVEVPTLVPQLRALTTPNGSRPQLVFRLGRPRVPVSSRSRRLRATATQLATSVA
jgi:hypothetical protein